MPDCATAVELTSAAMLRLKVFRAVRHCYWKSHVEGLSVSPRQARTV